MFTQREREWVHCIINGVLEIDYGSAKIVVKRWWRCRWVIFILMLVGWLAMAPHLNGCPQNMCFLYCITNNELLQIKIISNRPIDNKTHFILCFSRFLLDVRCANEKHCLSSKVCTYLLLSEWELTVILFRFIQCDRWNESRAKNTSKQWEWFI